MPEHQIRFNDGAAYERMMGVWSRMVGADFLDWLATPLGLRWADIGCGSGAFTELVVERCAPAEVRGIDASEAQVAFARARPASWLARFDKGDAMALPFGDASVDAAVMALVLFFVPDPAKGVAEMARVTVPGGLVAAYVWDFPGGGYVLQALQDEMRAMGLKPPIPPNAEVARAEALRELWTRASLVEVETRKIEATRVYSNFDEFWTTSMGGSSMASILASLNPDAAERLKERARALYPAHALGRVTNTGWVNAVKGRVPG